MYSVQVTSARRKSTVSVSSSQLQPGTSQCRDSEVLFNVRRKSIPVRIINYVKEKFHSQDTAGELCCDINCTLHGLIVSFTNL